MKLNFRLFSLLLLTSPLSIQAADDPITIEVWTRAPGSYARIENPRQLKLKVLPIEQQVAAKLFDSQYEKEYEYKGNFLHELVERYEPAAPSDMILLHFDNKMIVPMPLELVKKANFEVFVATSIKAAAGFTHDFPPIAKPSERWRDPRPLSFHGNKVVISKPWHPGLQKLTPVGFLPWKSTGSLVGIEWVDAAAYRAQFDFDAKAEVRRGQQVYLQRCVFCHAVRQVGGRLGWDFVDPLPIFQKRSEQTLHAHVKYPKLDALERGLLMPSQPDFSEDEATALWHWMRAAATQPLKPYK